MKNYCKNVLLLFFAIIVGLFLDELVIALFYPQPVRGVTLSKPFHAKYDPELGWVNKEGADGEYRHGVNTEPFHIHINSLGVRGGEIPYRKPANVKRVLVLGDSITFGFLNEAFTFPFLLGKRLGSGYEIVNMGVTGYSPDQEYLLFKREGLNYHPDVVILQIALMDIREMSYMMKFGYFKPYFKFEAGRLKLMNTPIKPKPAITDIFFSGKPVKRFIFEHSHLYRLLFYKFIDIGASTSMVIPAMGEDEIFGVFSKMMETFNLECREAGATLLVIIIPFEEWLSLPEGSIVDMQSERLFGIFKNLGIRYIDFAPLFKEHIREGLFIKNDPVHPNDRGNALIADFLASEILKR